MAIKSTTKRIYPNYVNADWITNKHDPRPISLISVPALDKDVICSIINRDNDTQYTNTKIEEIWNTLSDFKNNEVLFKDGYYYPDIYLKSFLGIPVPIDTFNIVYFVFVSLWLCNIVALGLTVIYGICRMMNAHAVLNDLKCRL